MGHVNTRTWKKGKATGPDAITHELLWTLLQEPQWEVRMAMGDTLTSIPQTNGVRQGSPDSPVLFGRVVADDLESALGTTQHMLPPAQGPPPPQSGGGFHG